MTAVRHHILKNSDFVVCPYFLVKNCSCKTQNSIFLDVLSLKCNNFIVILKFDANFYFI